MDGCSETWLTHAIGIFGLRGRGGDAMVGEVDHVAAAGVRGAVRARGGEPSRVVSAVWHQCDHRLRAAGALSSGGAGGPVAAPAPFAHLHGGGSGEIGAGGSR